MQRQQHVQVRSVGATTRGWLSCGPTGGGQVATASLGGMQTYAASRSHSIVGEVMNLWQPYHISAKMLAAMRARLHPPIPLIAGTTPAQTSPAAPHCSSTHCSTTTTPTRARARTGLAQQPAAGSCSSPPPHPPVAMHSRLDALMGSIMNLGASLPASFFSKQCDRPCRGWTHSGGVGTQTCAQARFRWLWVAA